VEEDQFANMEDKNQYAKSVEEHPFVNMEKEKIDARIVEGHPYVKRRYVTHLLI